MQSDMDTSVPASRGKRQRRDAASTSPDGTRGKKQKLRRRRRRRRRRRSRRRRRRRSRRRRRRRSRGRNRIPGYGTAKKVSTLHKVIYMQQRPSMTRLLGCLQ